MNRKLLAALLFSATAAAIAGLSVAGCGKSKGDTETDDVKQNLTDDMIDDGTGTIVNPADKYTQSEIEEMLAPFEYEIESSGTYTVTGLKDKTATAAVIPDCAALIDSFAFGNCTSLISVTIGDGVMRIGTCAFENCTALTSLTIGGGVTNIEDSAFCGCSSLESVIIPDNVQSIGMHAFEDCTALTSLTIGSGVTYIELNAFHSCTALTSVTIPDSVEIIADGAFGYCTSLTSITIPNGVTKIVAAFLQGCTSLTSITVDEGNENYKSVDGNLYSKDGRLVQYAAGKKDTSFSIPDGVTSIGEYAFSGCTSLTSVTIPGSVTDIDDYAFWGCTSLAGVTFENTAGWTVKNTSLLSSDLIDASTAAAYLTDTYCGYYWKRS